MATGRMPVTVLILISADVILSSKPEFRYFWPSGPIQAGDPMKFVCYVYPDNVFTMTWMKDGKAITTSSHVTIRENNHVLAIRNTIVKDTGNYTCTAVSKDRKNTKSHQEYIEVKDSWSSPPVVKNVSPPDGLARVRMGSSVNISCSFSSGEICNQQEMAWLRNGTYVEDTARIQWLPGDCVGGSTSLVLQIANITEADLGTYTCYGGNEFGNDTREITVTNFNASDGTQGWGRDKLLSVIIPSAVGVLVVVALLVGGIVFRSHRRKPEEYEQLQWEEPDLTHFAMPDCEVEYDAFISYSSDDLEWVKPVLFQRLRESGYNVCVDFKDFTPGMAIAENVMDSIYKSKRTLIVMSENFLKSMWGQFELQQAHNRAVVKREDVIILVKLDNCKVPAKLMGKTFLDWSDVNVRPHFWQRLKEAIGEPGDFKNAHPMEKQEGDNQQPIEKADVKQEQIDERNIMNGQAGLVIDMDNNYLCEPCKPERQKQKHKAPVAFPHEGVVQPKICQMQ